MEFTKTQVAECLQGVPIGELGDHSDSHEVYRDAGLKLKSRVPLAATFNLETCHGSTGYIPPPEQHRPRGYTTVAGTAQGPDEASGNH